MILQVGTLDETFTVGENISDSCCCKEISEMLFCSMPFLMGKLIRKNGQKCKVSLRRCGSIFRLLPRFINGGSITFEKRVKSCYYIPHTLTPFFSLVEIPLLGFAQLTLLTIKWHLSS